MIERARQYGCYVSRRVAAMLIDAGWHLNDKQSNVCGALRSSMTDLAFVSGRSTSITFGHMTSSIIDEFSRECLAIRVKRRLNSTDVIAALTDLFIFRGVPAYSRSDNGSEFSAEAARQWIKAVGAVRVYIAPGSPWGNGHCESFNARFRDEL